jgi:hypothetical protein
MPMLGMNTTKPMNPIVENLRPPTTLDSGAQPPREHPDQQPGPADPARRRPRDKDGHRVQRNEHAPAEEVAGSVGHQGNGCESVGSGRQRGLSRGWGNVGRR